MASAVTPNTNNYLNNGSSQTYLGPAVSVEKLTAYSALNNSGARLQQAGLAPGGVGLLGEIAGKVLDINFQSATGRPIDPEIDWRIRVSTSPSLASEVFYGNSQNAIMRPLNLTKGVVFPYTPSIQVSQSAKYGSVPLTHSNYASYFYEYSEVAAIRITGEFTVQNIAEGQYLMAAIQFFRACTKMFYGNSLRAGSPPPLLFLDGYGPYFPHVPCVLTQFDHTLPKDVDYVPVPIGVLPGSVGTDVAQANDASLKNVGQAYGSLVNLPTHSEVTISLQPVYSRKNIAANFTLEKYAKGGLIENGTSPFGGFI